ncbi:cytochrome bd-I oxidase subunit CydX [Vibrio parahaemolyticus]|nr:cytochrome bd-I oxidase subunit CydX [Vibrio parahaemolyticus]EGQ8084434.1 cytochrome bd-I oxidase subunit CydX [Vibrio parahaemolyticus]EID0733636.1 cytochrome bd-I oxidase subunit CydX [Vibrio parahaemolyticus]ELA9417209.1 cytochrome bd-I oxidase subunit CydX [Vibrio parahaemolyticus]
MWYMFWIIGILLACLFGIIIGLWLDYTWNCEEK